MSRSPFAERRVRELFGFVWCTACETEHIPTIPVVTFACGDCGFGVWDMALAEEHAFDYPRHAVYAAHHTTIPQPPPPPDPAAVETQSEETA